MNFFGEAFEIYIYSTKGNLFDFEKYQQCHSIVDSRNMMLRSNPIDTQADPFLFVYNKELYLFFEEKNCVGKGFLKMTKSKDLINWTKPIIVLKENFHLSFPFVFSMNGKVYMMPETNENNCIAIYEAIDESLSSFSLKKKIIELAPHDDITLSFVDSSFVEKDGICYLMTTIKRNEEYSLELYYADSLMGEFVKHPCSPLCVSNKYGRNGGRIQSYDGSLYRFSQDCFDSYGNNITVHRINRISETEYEEEVFIENLIPNKDPFKIGGHQFNFCEFNNQLVVALDAKHRHNYFYQRAINKVKSMLK